MNAIILAAGLGSRLYPITKEIPKCMVAIDGIPIIENQISALQEIGINDIYIISGYKHDKLNYISDKYKVKLIYNDKYDIYNNFYSLYIAYKHIGDTLILEQGC